MAMSAEAEEMMWKAITVIEAQETLIGFQVSAYPQMKKSAQEQLHKSLHRMAFPEVYEKPITLTAEGLARLING